MEHLISIIIPNYNGSRTIGKCLESIFAFNDDNWEVIVVDDCSEDRSIDIIGNYPCRLIQLERHAGASAARNAGAFGSKGDILFFIDADCLLKDDTLLIIRNHLSSKLADVVIGGTYTSVPQDPGFFNQFQSAFINYFETKSSSNPDYLATHALVINAGTFRMLGGFTENFLPILEDVEFCHRLRRAGYRLIMDPDLQVRHIFNHSFMRSIQNAEKKARYWTMYSLANRDLFADSGTASREIKLNGVAWLATVAFAFLFLMSGQRVFLLPLPLLWASDVFVNRYLFKAFYKAGGAFFALMAGTYYVTVYPAAVWLGAVKGAVQYSLQKKMKSGKGGPRELYGGTSKE